MIGAGHLIGHRDWAPRRKSDPGPYLIDQLRDWAPNAPTIPPTEEADMDNTQDARLRNTANHAAHADEVVSVHLAPLRAEVAAGFAAIAAVIKQIPGGGAIDMAAVQAAAKAGAADALDNIKLITQED